MSSNPLAVRRKLWEIEQGKINNKYKDTNVRAIVPASPKGKNPLVKKKKSITRTVTVTEQVTEEITEPLSPQTIHLNGMSKDFVTNFLQTVDIVQNIETICFSNAQDIQDMKKTFATFIQNISIIYGELVNELTNTRLVLFEKINQLQQVKQISYNASLPQETVVDTHMIEDEVDDEEKAKRIIKTAISTNSLSKMPSMLELRSELLEHPLFIKCKDKNNS